MSGCLGARKGGKAEGSVRGGWFCKWMGGWINSWMGAWMDGRMEDGWVYKRMDLHINPYGWLDRWVYW